MRTFAGILIQPYIGQPFKATTQLCGREIDSVPVLINWSAYGASSINSSRGVALNLTGQGTRSALIPKLVSVYIDNTASNVPVYLLFPDTLQVVVAQPYSSGWFLCPTNGFECTVYGIGFVTGNIPLTQLLFVAAPIPPFVSLEISQAQSLFKASRSITRGTTIFNQDFTVPAIGDQLSQNILPVAGTTPAQNVMNTPYAAPNSFLYLTNLTLNAVGVANPGSVQYVTVTIASTGPGGTLIQVSFYVGATVESFTFFEQGGMNVKLDATQTWQISRVNNGDRGFINAVFCFSTNPN